MKALTIKQPWGSLIIRGGKNIENREWPTRVRGLIAIHTSAKMEKSEMEDACDFMKTFVPHFSQRMFEQDRYGFPTGSIIGVAEIVDCVRESESPWFVGSYGFVLRNQVAFDKPIPCRGALGFWDVPDSILTEMRAQYKLARAAATPLLSGESIASV